MENTMTNYVDLSETATPAIAGNERKLTKPQLRIIGKILNVPEGMRLAWIEGIADYVEVSGLNDPFVVSLCDYMAEHGSKESVLFSFSDAWKLGKV